jgi:hypothetical protein
MTTRAQADAILKSRVGTLLTNVGVSVAGSSPLAAFADPIAVGLDAVGLSCADPTNPTDDDLAALPGSSLYKFLDIAELRALETAYNTPAGTATATSVEWTDYKVTRKAAVDALATVLAAKRADVKARWGYGLGRLSAGTIDLKFTGGGSTEF